MRRLFLYGLVISAFLATRAVDYEVKLKAESQGVPYLECEGVVRYDTALSDTLIPLRYFMEFRIKTTEGSSQGITAYADSTYYDFVDHVWNSEHFTGNSTINEFREKVVGGYFNLMGPMSVRGLGKLLDSCSTTSFDGNIIHFTTRFPGHDIVKSKGTLTFNTDSMIVKSEITNSPGEAYETTIVAEYSYPDSVFPKYLQLTHESIEAYLADDYALYGPTTIEQLPGRFIPFFTAYRGKGRIYRFNPDYHSTKPEVWVAFDKPSEELRPVLQSIIEAVPQEVDLLVFFESNRLDLIDELVKDMDVKYVHYSTHNFFELLGIRKSPTIIFRNTDGRVADVIIWQNNALGSVVNKIAKTLK